MHESGAGRLSAWPFVLGAGAAGLMACAIAYALATGDFAADGAVPAPRCFYNGYQADTDLNQPQFREHLLHSALVNEVQIELTSRGAEYPRRLS